MKVSPSIGFNGFLTPLVGIRNRTGTRDRDDVRRSDVPAAQVEPDNGDEALYGVVNGGHGEEGLGVSHEAVRW